MTRGGRLRLAGGQSGMTSVSPVGGASAAGFGYSAYTPADGGRWLEHGAAGRRTGSRSTGSASSPTSRARCSLAEETLARGRADEIATWGRRTEDWVPPSNLGPLPLDLRERAARLLQHQLAVAEALVERITQSQPSARPRGTDVARPAAPGSRPTSTAPSDPLGRRGAPALRGGPPGSAAPARWAATADELGTNPAIRRPGNGPGTPR